MADGDDVLDQPRGGLCPICNGKLYPPEIDYDTSVFDGPGSYWCPGCGYEEY